MVSSGAQQAHATRWRSRGILLLKVAVAAALLVTLAHSDRLSFTKLRLFIDEPSTLAVNAGVWASIAVIAAIRWRILLAGLQVNISVFRLGVMQMISGFFGLVLPSFGGDVVRALYGARGQTSEQAGSVVLSVLLDRVCGLCGLFLAGALGISLNFATAWEQPSLRPLVVYIGGGCAALVCGLMAFLFLPSGLITRPLAWIDLRAPKLKRLTSLAAGLLNFQKKRGYLLGAIGLSTLSHMTLMLYYRYIIIALTGQAASVAAVVTTAPLAMLVTAVPLTPGGFGIGHVAFERFFALAGLSGGADVFNVATLGQMAMGLTGVVPYLLLRSEFSSLRGNDGRQKAATESDAAA